MPAAPALVNIQYDEDYRRALVESDMAIADSGFMVILWRLLRHRSVTRISGLTFLKRLLGMPQLRNAGAVFLIVPTEMARQRAMAWFREQGFVLTAGDFYVAPRYGCDVADEKLARLLESRCPRHIVVGLGGGVQEKLGRFLRDALEYRPAIHCIGASLGFLTGDQSAIPDWADRLFLGWVLRLLRNPRLYARRFWVAHELPGLIWRYGSELPPIRNRSAA